MPDERERKSEVNVEQMCESASTKRPISEVDKEDDNYDNKNSKNKEKKMIALYLCAQLKVSLTQSHTLQTITIDWKTEQNCLWLLLSVFSADISWL